ncbi:transposase [Streptomyces sp. SAI-129]
MITTAPNVNDIAQTINLVDGIPPVAGRLGRPRLRLEAVFGDKAYDSKAVRLALRRRRILPVIPRKGAPNIKGLGKLRYVVEQTFALLHQFKRLTVRWERRPALHDTFLNLASSLICWWRLKKTGSAGSVESRLELAYEARSWGRNLQAPSPERTQGAAVGCWGQVHRPPMRSEQPGGLVVAEPLVGNHLVRSRQHARPRRERMVRRSPTRAGHSTTAGSSRSTS